MINAIKNLVKSKFFKNSSALIIGKAVQMVLSLVVSILSARFLGSKNYGTVSYAASIVTFFIPICDLGIASVITYLLIQHSDNEEKVLGTAITLQVISAVFCIIGSVLVSYFLNLEDIEVVIVVGLYSLELLFKGFELLSYWFQVHYISKYQAISGIIVYIFVSAYKIVLLVFGASVRWFALSMTLDYLLTAIVYLFLYFRKGGKRFSFSRRFAKILWKNGKSFILSGLMVVIYMQTDKIMLEGMIGASEVAFYTVSASIVTTWGFVVAAIISAASPLIIEECKQNNTNINQLITSLYSLVIFVCLFFILFANLIIKELIPILYTNEYLPCIETFRILSFGSIFTYLGVSKNIWFVITGQQKYVKWLSGIGAMVNIVLNYVLINSIGLAGAAIATVFTEMTVNFLAGFFFKDIAHNSVLMIKALNPINIIKMKNLLTK